MHSYRVVVEFPEAPAACAESEATINASGLTAAVARGLRMARSNPRLRGCRLGQVRISAYELHPLPKSPQEAPE